MSLPLKDFRLGITESIDVALEACAAAFGKDKAAIARDVLQEWANRKAHEHKVYARRALANGAPPEQGGLVPEDAGIVRRAPIRRVEDG